MSHEEQPGYDSIGLYQDDEAGLYTSSQAGMNIRRNDSTLFPETPSQPDAMQEVDPPGLWAVTSGRPLSSSLSHDTSTPISPDRWTHADAGSHPQPERQNRRKFVKLLVVGAAGFVTAVTVGGVSLARSSHGGIFTPARIEDDQSEGSTTFNAHRESDDGNWRRKTRGKPTHHKKPTSSQSPTPQPNQTQTPQPTQTQPPQPTQTPKPTATAAPTGTVIGSTSQATNSAVSFTNPADGQGSFLIHLGNGNWVAAERACTHQGAWVNYDPTTGHLVCPAHGAIFDPANAFSVLQGPAASPLSVVSIHVNANGTITTP